MANPKTGRVDDALAGALRLHYLFGAYMSAIF
jgi:hypothetical protein